MLKKIGFAAAVTFFIASFPAYPLGLGELQVRSALSQPLDADIALVGTSDSQLDELKVSIPPVAAFESAGLRRLAVIDRIQVTLMPNHGHPYIHLSTKEGVRQPFLDILLRVESGTGALTREFTAFLNPPGFRDAPTVAASETHVAQSATVPAHTEPAPARIDPRPAPPPSGPSMAEGGNDRGLPATYGPVRRNQTLWSIARSLHPGNHGVTMDQMVMGIYSHNPDAFGGSINDLLAGSVLNIPSVPVVAAIDSGQARSAMKRQISEFEERNHPPRQVAVTAAGGHLELSAATSSEHSAGMDAQTDMSATPLAATSMSDTGGGNEVTNASNDGATPTVIPDAALAALVADAQASSGNPFQWMPLPATPTSAVDTVAATAMASVAQPASATDSAENDAGHAPVTSASSVAATAAVQQMASTKTQPETTSTTKDTTIEKTADKAGTSSSFVIGTNQGQETDQANQGSLQWLSSDQLRPAELTLVGIALVILLLVRLRRRSVSSKDGGLNADAPAPAQDDDLTQDVEMKFMANATDATGDDIDEALSDAELNIAFGLHDKALSALQPLIQLYPQRADLRLKELEVLHAAERAEQFAERAYDLRKQVDISEQDWLAVAAVGAELCPDDPLFNAGVAAQPVEEQTQAQFASSEKNAYAEATDDLGSEAAGFQMGEEETMETPLPWSVDAEAISVPVDHEDGDSGSSADTSADQVGDTNEDSKRDFETLEFDLTDVLPASTADDDTPVVDDKPDTVKFSLDDQVSMEPAPFEQGPEPEAAGGDPPNPALASGQVAGTDADSDDTLVRLDNAWDGDFGDSANLDLNTDWTEEVMPEVEEDVGTKLDLARAYLDMEDREVALGLIEEVIRQGDTAQREEAEALKSRI